MCIVTVAVSTCKLRPACSHCAIISDDLGQLEGQLLRKAINGLWDPTCVQPLNLNSGINNRSESLNYYIIVHIRTHTRTQI